MYMTQSQGFPPAAEVVTWTTADEERLIELDREVASLQLKAEELRRASTQLREMKRKFVIGKKEKLTKILAECGIGAEALRDQIAGYLMRNSEEVIQTLSGLPSRKPAVEDAGIHP